MVSMIRATEKFVERSIAQPKPWSQNYGSSAEERRKQSLKSSRLPAEVMRRVKFVFVHRGITVKQFIIDSLEHCSRAEMGSNSVPVLHTQLQEIRIALCQ